MLNPQGCRVEIGWQRDIHGSLNGYSCVVVMMFPCALWSMFSAAITSRWNVFPQDPHVLYLDRLCASVA